MDYHIFENLSDGVIALDNKMRVLYANEAAHSLCGLGRTEMRVGAGFAEIIKFDNPELSVGFKTCTFETCSKKSGRIQVALRPLEGDVTSTGYLVYLRDAHVNDELNKRYRAELDKKEDLLSSLRAQKDQLTLQSKHLERTLEQCDTEAKRNEALLKSVLESLDQAYIIIDPTGNCLQTYSKNCKQVFGSCPEGKKIWDMLGLEQPKLNEAKIWFESICTEPFPFEELASFGPSEFTNLSGVRMGLKYHALRGEGGKISNVVLVATDKPQELVDRWRVGNRVKASELIVSLIRNKTQVAVAVRYTRQGILELREKIAGDSLKSSDLPGMMRILHTIKGVAASFGLLGVADVAHDLETKMTDFTLETLDQQYDRAIECHGHFDVLEGALDAFLQQYRNVLGDIEVRERTVDIKFDDLQSFLSEMQRLPGTEKLQARFVSQLMREPICVFFSNYNSIIEEVALEKQKDVGPIIVKGGNTRVLGARYSELFNTLVHLVRNAVDHGIELSDARIKAGKSPTGTLTIIVSTELTDFEAWLKIIFKDDGRGIDPAQVKSKLKEMGQDLSTESSDQVIQHIFDPGFSTSEGVDRVSGRGVGLSAVREAVKKLGGEVLVSSVKGKGTMIVIRVPEQSVAVQNPQLKLVA